MSVITGNELVAETLKRIGVDTLFFLMGGPINEVLRHTLAKNIRGIDVRHEQAAAMMAHAYARITNKPGLCMAASGPGTMNLTTGIANALIDCSPIVALGGASPLSERGTGYFQEIDQLSIMKPITKWAERAYETRRLPELIDLAFRQSIAGKPGPCFLDLPADVLYAEVEQSEVNWPDLTRTLRRSKPEGDTDLVEEAISLLEHAERPVILSGSGVFWSDGIEALRLWVERTGIPLYTTPQGRGVVPEDHALSLPNARGAALKDADFVLVVGTRLNYVFGNARPPRVSATAKVVRIDIDPQEIAGCQRSDIGIVGDAGAVMKQFLAASSSRITANRFAPWRKRLGQIEESKRASHETALATDNLPIHPLRLCKELRDFMDRDAILVVDGQEILNYGRQSIPTFFARHRINSGTFGTMGVGLPFGIAAKLARPEKQTIVLHGDGSFGLNAMELDTAVRHNVPVIIVISLNGGWTADPKREKPGRDLGYTRFDLMAQSLGCYGEYVEKPSDIRPALDRAKQAITNGKPAIVNVVTDFAARATTVKFTRTST